METKKLERFLSTVPTELVHPKITYRNVRHDFEMMMSGPPNRNIAYTWHAEYRGLVLDWIKSRLSRKNLPKYQREYLDELYVLLITIQIIED